MIIIETPTKRSDGNNNVVLSSRIVDEDRHIDTSIYYRVPSEYGYYLVDEVVDAFLLIVLLPAILTRQDIHVKAPISQDLSFQLQNGLLYLLSSVFKTSEERLINIILEHTPVSDSIFKDSFANACGCSLGVDSLSAIKYLTSTHCPSGFKLSHLTYFNIGALGEYDVELANQVFRTNLVLIQDYARHLSLPLVTVESNSSILYTDLLDFEQTHSLRNACAVIALKKLFKRYYYASSFPIDRFKLTNTSMSFFDSLLLPMLSSPSLSFYVVDLGKSRTEKTSFISDDPFVQHSLYVCWKDIISNGNPLLMGELSKVPYLNCTRCDKCLRTVLTLDILGVLDKFSALFDLDYYRTHRQAYLLRVLSERENDYFYDDICRLMSKRHYIINRSTRLMVWSKRHHMLGAYKIIHSVLINIRSFFTSLVGGHNN